MTRVAVIDYGIGNLHSAQKALTFVGADALLTASAGDIDAADAVVLPGVGNFGACMTALRERGLDQVATRAACDGRPFLGICVGMQLLFESSEESPGVDGLGVLPGTVTWLSDGVKRPQMQWNLLHPRRDDPCLGPADEPQWMYFVHSLRAVPSDPSIVVATVDYGDDVVAAVRRDAVFAVQFHPEKSSPHGLDLLRRWVATIGGDS